MGRVAAELLAERACRMALDGSSSPLSVGRARRASRATSSIDLRPKFGIAASSFSDFEVRSPIVSMPTRLRQLYERTPSSSSSIGKFSIPCEVDGASASAAAAASPRPSIRAGSAKIASCPMRSSAARAIASFGSSEPSVVDLEHELVVVGALPDAR